MNYQSLKLNIPNLISLARMISIPFTVWLIMNGSMLAAFWVFVAAGFSDALDGYIAKRFDLRSEIGAFLDPIADKAITGMAFIGLAVVGDIWWWVTIVVLLREWSVTLLRLSVLSKVVIAAKDLGKWKTTAQALALGGLVLPLRDPDLPSALQTPGEVLFYVSQGLLAVAVALTLWSGWEFYRDVWKQRHQLRG